MKTKTKKPKYRTIRTIISKPSQALEMMVKGLIRQGRRKTFVIDMGTFGEVTDDGFCCGCAATCALQEVSGVRISRDYISTAFQRALACEFEYGEVSDFERAINFAREGSLRLLFIFFGVDYKWYESRDDGNYSLTTENWREQLPAVRKHIKELKEIGL